MADFSALKQSIQNYIKQNGNKEITGNLLQNILLSMVTTMGDGAINEIASNIDSFLSAITAITTRLNTGALYAGYATPSTTPAALTGQEVFYLATQAGTYTNFHFNGGDDPIVLTKDGIYFMVSGNGDDDWNAEPMLQLDDVPTASSNNAVKSGGVQNELALGAIYDVSAKNPTAGPNSDGKWESLSALLSDANLNTLIPTAVRKGGMSIKFVQSFDNKYVQYRLMKNTWSTTVSDWQGVDDKPTAGSHNLVESGGVNTAIQNNPNIGYFVCDTAAGTAAKTVSSANYILPTAGGGCIKIKMTNANTAASGVTLKIGSANAKPLYYAGQTVSASNTWKAGETIEVYYDGTNYQANNVAGGGGSGVYDISAEHSNTAYADLAAALGTNGANVPTSIRNSGMSVKFLRAIPATYYVSRTAGVEEIPTGGILLDSTPSIYNGTYTASQLSAFATLPESTSADAVVYYVAVTVDETTTYTTWSITMVSANAQKYEQYRYTLPYENTTAGNNNFKNTVNWQKESIFENGSDSIDFSLKDEKGNVIFQIANGHIKTKFFDSSLLNNRTHWYGKKWFAYGTSMTNTSNEGKYPKYIDKLSGMIRTNRGFSGGGITTSSNQAIYNAICSMDDNKDTADLITLEIGANDDNAPLGDFTSYADNSTFIGALILCIRYLQEHTNAQIVVFPSPHQRKIVFPSTVICDGTQTFGSDHHTMLDRDDAIRKVCMMYDVPFIAPCSNLGYARMNASDLYNRDQIHHTELGGLNYALSIWAHLKNIQPFIVYNN